MGLVTTRCRAGDGNDSLLGNVGDNALVVATAWIRWMAGIGNDLLDGGSSTHTLLGRAGAGPADRRQGKACDDGGAVMLDVFAFSVGDTAAANGFVDIDHRLWIFPRIRSTSISFQRALCWQKCLRGVGRRDE